MQKIFIHTNNKQGIGAVLSKFSIERSLSNKSIEVGFINVDNLNQFKNFAGKKYLRAGKESVYNPKDLQSFTLSRFMPPELMNYEGRALVIDPDIFALSDISELFSVDMREKAIACCSKKDAWDTSMMVLDCARLKHWKIEDILNKLEKKELDYSDIMTLKIESRDTLMEMSRIWNNLDTLTPETKMIHMTNRLTQPWRTGLPIDFTRNPMPKILGIIPREPIHKILGKYPTHYKQHPIKEVEKWFFKLVDDAIKSGELTKEEIEEEIQKGEVRKDLLNQTRPL